MSIAVKHIQLVTRDDEINNILSRGLLAKKEIRLIYESSIFTVINPDSTRGRIQHVQGAAIQRKTSYEKLWKDPCDGKQFDLVDQTV